MTHRVSLMVLTALVAIFALAGCQTEPADTTGAVTRSREQGVAASYDPDDDIVLQRALQSPSLQNIPEYRQHYKPREPVSMPEGMNLTSSMSSAAPTEPAPAPVAPATDTGKNLVAEANLMLSDADAAEQFKDIVADDARRRELAENLGLYPELLAAYRNAAEAREDLQAAYREAVAEYPVLQALTE